MPDLVDLIVWNGSDWEVLDASIAANDAIDVLRHELDYGRPPEFIRIVSVGWLAHMTANGAKVWLLDCVQSK